MVSPAPHHPAEDALNSSQLRPPPPAPHSLCREKKKERVFLPRSRFLQSARRVSVLRYVLDSNPTSGNIDRFGTSSPSFGFISHSAGCSSHARRRWWNMHESVFCEHDGGRRDNAAIILLLFEHVTYFRTNSGVSEG